MLADSRFKSSSSTASLILKIKVRTSSLMESISTAWTSVTCGSFSTSSIFFNRRGIAPAHVANSLAMENRRRLVSSIAKLLRFGLRPVTRIKPLDRSKLDRLDSDLGLCLALGEDFREQSAQWAYAVKPNLFSQAGFSSGDEPAHLLNKASPVLIRPSAKRALQLECGVRHFVE
jgi:hypothetical protein